ncbi:PREDICTED: cathepsin L-like [Papilio xuthus]|uniref:Cathepsin L-like n=1 Tax=Papilio xuthus TaxID=66420 RepID=A0AAJ6Z5L5_PAPXU|nr:PREDICTED: cathepsin L-like [Papilio xuthus]
MEGQVYLSRNKLVSLSEQNLVDCASRGDGCSSSSNMLAAFTYIAENQGIDTENTYPYYGRKLRCAFKNDTVGAKSAGYTTIMDGSEEVLQEAVATQGPIAVVLSARNVVLE